jgi:type I restriction enzyme M protein
VAQPKGFEDKVSLIWSIADILRGDFKPHEYGSIILPFVVLRRLECALETTKSEVIKQAASLAGKIENVEPVLRKASKHTFYNTSPLDLGKLLQDPNKIGANLNTYIGAFSPSAAEVLEKYGFSEKVKKLDEQGLLYQVVSKFADVDLSEGTVSNEAMGYVFEELLRKFSEMSNETAGEHYTPREVIRLMVNLLFIEDVKALSAQKPVRTLYDPACGTGGMLSIAEEYLHDLNPNIQLEVFGQELNPETWAIARSDLMIKGQDPAHITLGNSLTDEDGHSGRSFDYCISNPPYGVDWKKYSEPIQSEFKKLGFNGRYGAGLPPVDDGSLLFVQHMLSKMKKLEQKSSESVEGGSRIAVILSGTPMYSGQAGSGESEIRKWILENDYLEGIVALPDQMFYNTPIGTYVWILTNRKNPRLRNKIKFVDAKNLGTKKKPSLGDKRKELLPSAIEEITNLYSEVTSRHSTENSKVLDRDDFIYQRITLEQPLRCRWELKPPQNLDASALSFLYEEGPKIFETESEIEDFLRDKNISGKLLRDLVKNSRIADPGAKIYVGKKGEVESDSKLRDQENLLVPKGYLDLKPEERADALRVAAESYLNTEVRQYLPDAWIDHSKTKIGAELSFTRQFFVQKLPRSIQEIDLDLRTKTDELITALKGLL